MASEEHRKSSTRHADAGELAAFSKEALGINGLKLVSKEVVEAARDTLVIGVA